MDGGDPVPPRRLSLELRDRERDRLPPRPPKFVQGFADRHGRPRFYLRRRGFKQVPLPGLPWSSEFMAAYEQGWHRSRPLEIGASRTTQAQCGR